MKRVERMIIIKNDEKTNKKSFWTIYSCYEEGKYVGSQLDVDGRTVMQATYLNDLVAHTFYWDVDNLPSIDDENSFFKKFENLGGI